MLAIGTASVLHWRATERAGEGNVVPYVIVQGSAILPLAWIAAALPSRYTRSRDVGWVLAWYALAKLCEAFDDRLFQLGHFVSGHTLKHLAAATAGFVVCVMLWRRTPIADAAA